MYRDNPDIARLVRRAIALPLVPVNCVGDVWWEALEDAPRGANVTRFKDYVTTFWVEGDHGRSMWNHFNTVGPRTTNHVEGWHRKLSLFLQSHPNIFKMVDFFKQEQSYVEACCIQLHAGAQPPPRKRRYVQVDNRLAEFKRQFLGQQIGIMEYYDSVSHLTGY